MLTPRNRLLYFFIVLLTIVLGLASRTSIVPDWVYPYLGDTLYAVMIYFGCGLVFPRISAFRLAIACLFICYTIEIAQLIDVSWLNALRSTIVGKLVLGSGFFWSDLICYAIGAAISFSIDTRLLSSYEKKLT